MAQQRYPQRLSETAALAVLQTHCSSLRGRLVFEYPLEGESAHTEQHDLAVECLGLDDAQLANGLGTQLRMALEIVHAVSSCSGLKPHENQRFWRHAVASLWIKCPGADTTLVDGRELFAPEPSEFRPFSSVAFSRFSIDVVNSEPSNSGLAQRVTLLWQQLALFIRGQGGDALVHETTAAAAAALAYVRGFVPTSTSPKRRLWLSLRLPLQWRHNPAPMRLCVEPRDAPLYVATIQAIGNSTATTTTTTTTIIPTAETTQLLSSVDWSIALHPRTGACFEMGSASVYLPWLRLLVLAHAQVPCVTLSLRFEPAIESTSTSPQYAGLETERQFSELLASVVLNTNKKTNTRPTAPLRSLIVCWRPGVSTTGALFSLIPHGAAKTLHHLQLSTFTFQPIADLWHWLAYAVLHPNCQRLPTTFQLTVACDASDDEAWIDRIVATEMPLRPVAETLLASTVVSATSELIEWFCLGVVATVVVVADEEEDAGRGQDTSTRSAAYIDPLRRHVMVKRLACGTVLDAVVRVPYLAIVGVVVPAYGLCWVASDAVVIGGHHQQDSLVSPTQVQLLRALASVRRYPLDKWKFANLTQMSLVSLTFAHPRYGVKLDSVSLRALLRSCPSLRHLSLFDCTVASLEPLVAAYAYAPIATPLCRIESLELSLYRLYSSRPRTPLDLVPLFEMLAHPTHPGARTLRRLALFNLSWTLLAPFADILRVNHTLERVFVALDDAEPEYSHVDSDANAAIAQCLAPFRDQVLNDGTAARLGLLSVLRAAHRRHDNGRGGGGGVERQTMAVMSGVDSQVLKTIFEFTGPTVVRYVRWRRRLPSQYFDFE